MPTEIRHVIFTNEEVVRAVLDYHRRSGQALPTGSILRVTFEREPVLRCALHLSLDADNSRQIYWIDEKVLAAALILFCINQKIPLPTKAAKTLQMVGEQVALLVNKTPADRNR